MKFMLGEMSEMLLNGVNADASKLKESGFTFKFETIETAMS
jgi:NAD dependent epimerase/dehydratase family enzyme